MTPLQQQLAQAVTRLEQAEPGTREYLELSREHRRLLREQQDVSWRGFVEKQYPPVQFERRPDEGLL